MSIPERGPESIGAWDIVPGDRGVELVRRTDDSPYNRMVWSDVDRVPGKGDARRVVLIGESTARGYLIDPVRTPTDVLQQILDRRCGAGAYQCVDLAQTSGDLGAMRRLVDALPHLDADLLVVFAGNNWPLSQLRPDVLGRLGEPTMEGGYSGMAAAFDEILVADAAAFVEHVATTAGGAGIEVVVVVPEFNLLGWSPLAGEDQVETCALRGTDLRRWYELREDAETARLDADWSRLAGIAERMREVDGGNSPAPGFLLGTALRAVGRHAQARPALERSRDCLHNRLLWHLPRAPAAVQDLLVAACRERGWACVDLRIELAGPDTPDLPDEDHFLDYCHLSDSGTARAMGAVADRITDRCAEPDEWSDATLPSRERGIVFLLAAIYNSFCGQPAEVVGRYLDRAIGADPAVRPHLHALNGMLGRAGPAWSSSDFARLTREPNVAKVLVPLAEARPRATRLWSLREALAERGLRPGPSDSGSAAPPHDLELVDIVRGRLGCGAVPNFTAPRGFLQVTRRRTTLRFVPVVGGSATLRIVHRVRSDVDDAAEVTFNGTPVGTLDPCPSWTTSVLSAGRMIPGEVNHVVITWGVPEIDVPAQLAADAEAMTRGEAPEVLPTFGEVFSARVRVESISPSQPGR